MFTCIIVYAVILDLKALYLSLVKKNEEDFQLGKRGLEVNAA